MGLRRQLLLLLWFALVTPSVNAGLIVIDVVYEGDLNGTGIYSYNDDPTAGLPFLEEFSWDFGLDGSGRLVDAFIDNLDFARTKEWADFLLDSTLTPPFTGASFSTITGFGSEAPAPRGMNWLTGGTYIHFNAGTRYDGSFTASVRGQTVPIPASLWLVLLGLALTAMTRAPILQTARANS